MGTELRISITSKKMLMGVHEIGTASISLQDLAKGEVGDCTFLDESSLLRKTLILVKPGSRKNPNDRSVCRLCTCFVVFVTVDMWKGDQHFMFLCLNSIM